MTLCLARIPSVHPCSPLMTTTVKTLINVTMKLSMQITTQPLVCFSMMSTFSTLPMESNLKFGWDLGSFTLQALFYHLSAIFTFFVCACSIKILVFLQAKPFRNDSNCFHLYCLTNFMKSRNHENLNIFSLDSTCLFQKKKNTSIA